ncbi:4297_t:CDS:2 [Ambispora gerdemannii]|uniref:4297_t:CDS:1 n=1 Tax=Ambispora gerdemannii TaxID=144530 RepID=A0A9N9G7Z4_9GLOM|nr:4297_t:CDS:2 [Ambispora gerdemannii]
MQFLNQSHKIVTLCLALKIWHLHVFAYYTPSQSLISHSAFLLGEKIYFFGGQVLNGSLFYLDLTVDWNNKDPAFAKADGLMDLSTLRNATTNLVVKDNKPFTTDTTDTINSEMFQVDLSNTPYTYSKIKPHGQLPPVPRSYISSVVDSLGKIYLWGGDSADTYSNPSTHDNTMYIFDTNSSTWSYNKPSNAPDARDGYTATLLPNGKIVYIGGIYTNHGGDANINEILIYDTYNTRSPWSLMTARNHTELANRYGHSAVLAPNGYSIIIYGGDTSPSVLTSDLGLLVLDTRDYSWDQPYSQNAPDKYSTRRYHTATVHQNYMIVAFGVLRYSGSSLYPVQILDLSDGNYKWTENFVASSSPSSKKKIIIIGIIVSIIIVMVLGVSEFLIKKRRRKKVLVMANQRNVLPTLSYPAPPSSNNNNTTNNQTPVFNVPPDQSNLSEVIFSISANFVFWIIFYLVCKHIKSL